MDNPCSVFFVRIVRCFLEILVFSEVLVLRSRGAYPLKKSFLIPRG